MANGITNQRSEGGPGDYANRERLSFRLDTEKGPLKDDWSESVFYRHTVRAAVVG